MTVATVDLPAVDAAVDMAAEEADNAAAWAADAAVLATYAPRYWTTPSGSDAAYLTSLASLDAGEARESADRADRAMREGDTELAADEAALAYHAATRVLDYRDMLAAAAVTPSPLRVA